MVLALEKMKNPKSGGNRSWQLTHETDPQKQTFYRPKLQIWTPMRWLWFMTRSSLKTVHSPVFRQRVFPRLASSECLQPEGCNSASCSEMDTQVCTFYVVQKRKSNARPICPCAQTVWNSLHFMTRSLKRTVFFSASTCLWNSELGRTSASSTDTPLCLVFFFLLQFNKNVCFSLSFSRNHLE